ARSRSTRSARRCAAASPRRSGPPPSVSAASRSGSSTRPTSSRASPRWQSGVRRHSAANSDLIALASRAALRREWLAGLALVALTVTLYAQVIDYGFTWDDDDNVTVNVNLRNAHGLRRTWTDFRANQQYYPLTHTSFWLEYQAWRLNP